MAIQTPKDNLIILPNEVLPKIKNASEAELKILIYFFANPDCSVADGARDLGINVAQAESAVAFWRGAGIFNDSTAPKQRVANDTSAYRNYDSATLSNAIQTNSDFSMVCRVAADSLGKQLTKNDYSSLFYLFDFVGIPAPVICGIIEMCVGMDKKSLQYIFKKATALYEEGIDTYDKFENYLAKRELINSNIGKVRRLFGMGDRELTSKEKSLFDCWFGDWNFPFETVKLAYEKAIDTTGKLSTTYINGILRRWQESGYETVDDVNAAEATKPVNNTGAQSSFDTDEFFQAALKRGFGDE